MAEEEIRKRVKSLKSVYIDVLWYLLGCAVFTLLWFIFDRNEIFWPKYLMLVWSIALLIEIIRKKAIPSLSTYIFFLSPEWEERKVKEMLQPYRHQHKITLSRDKKKKI
jgi:hypothetical protein